MRKSQTALLIVLLLSAHVFGEGDRGKAIGKTNGIPTFTFFDINNISTFIYNDGGTDLNLNQGSGFEYPKGSRKALVYSSGLLWGAKVNDKVRVGGSTFRQGLVGGKILPDGTAEDFLAENVRVYRVRRDFADFENRDNIDVSSEINDQQGSAEQIRTQYIKDWNEWPASDGAPFEDTDGNGIYDPSIDIPGIPGADQTIWYVANDLDPYYTFELYGSPPIGIEMQATFWGYSNNSPADNIMFRRYVLINKSEDDFEEMYLSLWMDPDIGDAQDDLVGCDTLLNLGYAYNSSYYDQTYGNEAPAIGVKLLQGPMVEASSNETAKFYGNKIKGKKNLDMNSFHHIFDCCPPKYGDPVYAVYDLGTLNWYEYMKGNLRTGDPFEIPDRLGGGETKFPFSGDPINGTGWIDGIDYDSGDRRLGVGSGPFTMAAGDTQEVIYAHIAAGGTNSVNSLTAVSLLKQYAEFSQFLYNSDFVSGLELKNPEVMVYESDITIALGWGGNSASIKEIENYDRGGYKFQGYNIYQFSYPAEETKDAILIDSYDIDDGFSGIGSNSGLKRNIVITRDYINNIDLVNGKEYFFGVTSFSYNPDAEDQYKINESFPEIISIRALGFSPGFSSLVSVNESIPVNHISGESQGVIDAKVISPVKLTGKSYQVSFDNSEDNMLEIIITDKDNSQIVFSGLSIDRDEYQNITFDGINLELYNNSGSSDSYIPFSIEDVYEFSTVAKSFDKTKAASDIEQINVFPNPYYYKVESTGLQTYPDFVTFTHLPNRAVIKIFNMGGQLVDKIDKNTADQFLTWDLFAKWGRRISSGLYIVYIEMPDLGSTKILKLAVI